MPEGELVVIQAVNSEDSVQSQPFAHRSAFLERRSRSVFFLQLLAYEHNLNTGPGRKEEPLAAEPRRSGMSESRAQRNKAFVLEAFETLFNRKDFVAAEKFWSPNYIQHSAHIAPGREGLFNLVRSVPETAHYENQLIIAEGDYVIAHGRFTGLGRPAAWIAADVIRFEDGLLKEHWDVLQDEATKAESVSGLPMFGDTFPK
jgi:predicted SnoaL-like aldol condensation-catalyzing enzyme